MPIAELFTEKESNKDVYYLINKYVKQKDRICIVTDTKKGYDKLINVVKLIFYFNSLFLNY